MTPGELVRGRRETLGMPQAQLAQKASTTQAVVSRIESGRLTPTVEMLTRLAHAMDAELSMSLLPH
jgi:ribosome-binding protein aMBF1 (putative translation factor)